MKERREALGGYMPHRQTKGDKIKIPKLESFGTMLTGSGDREISSTMAFVRILSSLIRNKEIGKRIVPIVPDESRTFGMEGMFRQLGIWSSVGQLYTPEDADQLMFYKEDKNGQILQEGINEAGAMSSWIAAATSYSNHGLTMIPFYIYYSMFGFQRVGDLAWAAGDQRARGFLLGGTAGKTTLNGEGLQHGDGHSHVLSSTIPNCISYDPTFAYELAVIINDGMLRMFEKQEDVFYYITLMNENYRHPKLPEGAEEGIIKGLYLLSQSKLSGKKPMVQLLGSGAILNEVIKAQVLLEENFGIKADVWSATSFTELRREGLETTRWNLLHPTKKQKESYVSMCLNKAQAPVVAATDYMKIYADQIRQFVSNPYISLGTDGYGRSDTRSKLRSFFEVDSSFIVLASLKALVDSGEIKNSILDNAIKNYGVDPDRQSPAQT